MLDKQLLAWLAKKRGGMQVILVTGVFDLLHQEHKHFLQKAKGKGELLLVGIESDFRVKQLKGQNRPIWDQVKRQQALEQLKYIDKVFILPDEFSTPQAHEQLIAEIKPDILAISSHSPHQAEKKRIVEKYGGKVLVVHKHNPKVSTSKIVGG